jgi:hypothetical protein
LAVLWASENCKNPFSKFKSRKVDDAKGEHWNFMICSSLWQYSEKLLHGKFCSKINVGVAGRLAAREM